MAADDVRQTLVTTTRMFFAAENDLCSVAMRIELHRPLKYVHYLEMTTQPKFSTYESLGDIPHYNESQSGDVITDGLFFVTDRTARVKGEKISQRRGPAKFALSEAIMPGAITLRPGGMYKQQFIIAGSMATLGLNAFSRQLYQEFAAEIARSFDLIDEFYVGPAAKSMARGGVRLLKMGIRAAEGYELQVGLPSEDS